MKKLFHVSVVLSFLLLVIRPLQAETNNWQELFTDIPTITLAEIEQNLDDVVLVDVRPKFEYENSHRPGAVHISVSSRMFILQMEGLISKNKDKKIVVYCDSDNCIKSYRAVEKCRQNKLNTVVLFDLNKDMADSKQEKIYSQL